MTESTHNAENRGMFNEDGLVFSADYSHVMDTQVIPFLRRHRTDFSVNRGDTALFTSRFSPEGTPRGTVMIVHGFTESAEKFHEMSYNFLQMGMNVFAIDNRGHGRSARLKRSVRV